MQIIGACAPKFPHSFVCWRKYAPKQANSCLCNTHLHKLPNWIPKPKKIIEKIIVSQYIYNISFIIFLLIFCSSLSSFWYFLSHPSARTRAQLYTHGYIFISGWGKFFDTCIDIISILSRYSYKRARRWWWRRRAAPYERRETCFSHTAVARHEDEGLI